MAILSVGIELPVVPPVARKIAGPVMTLIDMEIESRQPAYLNAPHVVLLRGAAGAPVGAVVNPLAAGVIALGCSVADALTCGAISANTIWAADGIVNGVKNGVESRVRAFDAHGQAASERLQRARQNGYQTIDDWEPVKQAHKDTAAVVKNLMAVLGISGVNVEQEAIPFLRDQAPQSNLYQATPSRETFPVREHGQTSKIMPAVELPLQRDNKTAFEPAHEDEASSELEQYNSEAETLQKTLSYEWDEKSGTNVWKVDGEIVDSSNEEVQRFCADPSKNCPVKGTGSESAQPEADTDGATPTTETEAELASPSTNPVEESPSQNTASADSEAIGGMQSAGGNPVVTPGNSIWHGEGGFQGEEYDDNGLNGTSNIKQFKLWDSDDLAPQASSDVQQKAVTTERVIDEPVPRGSVYMPDEKYMADPNSEYGNHSADSNSSNFSPSKDVSKKKNTARSSRKNRNNTGRPRNTGCGPGMHAADYSTPFPKSCF